MQSQPPPYEFRARICGVVDWTCAWCGHLNRSRVTRLTWQVKCTGKPCRKKFNIGVTLHELPHSGHHTLPPPDIAMPVGTLAVWERGARVHRIVTTT
jgi:hypothetical protein